MERLQEAAIAIKGEWGVEIPEFISEAALLHKIAERVTALIEKSTEEFLQLMYRLDISEHKLHGVMHEADFAHKIARLIYDRQMEKIKSREMYSASNKEEDPDLKW